MVWPLESKPCNPEEPLIFCFRPFLAFGVPHKVPEFYALVIVVLVGLITLLFIGSIVVQLSIGFFTIYFQRKLGSFNTQLLFSEPSVELDENADKHYKPIIRYQIKYSNAPISLGEAGFPSENTENGRIE
ncbi:unnamed protein product [Caenorhabditis auriculariae]|uniref:Uncharacterized protein n=1 Tax=Caenorhabditis auriculariae TaxID=2777116 RepID=A0A8S1H4V6_9PELO|nr:unnamed protein product [Caenorhabditis auriculariae]